MADGGGDTKGSTCGVLKAGGGLTKHPDITWLAPVTGEGGDWMPGGVVIEMGILPVPKAPAAATMAQSFSQRSP